MRGNSVHWSLLWCHIKIYKYILNSVYVRHGILRMGAFLWVACFSDVICIQSSVNNICISGMFSITYTNYVVVFFFFVNRRVILWTCKLCFTLGGSNAMQIVSYLFFWTCINLYINRKLFTYFKLKKIYELKRKYFPGCNGAEITVNVNSYIFSLFLHNDWNIQW